MFYDLFLRYFLVICKFFIGYIFIYKCFKTIYLANLVCLFYDRNNFICSQYIWLYCTIKILNSLVFIAPLSIKRCGNILVNLFSFKLLRIHCLRYHENIFSVPYIVFINAVVYRICVYSVCGYKVCTALLRI